MNTSSRVRLENQILVKCSIAWPYTEHRPLAFQKNIGTTLLFDNRSTAELPPFFLAIFRRDEKAREFFRHHADDLRKYVNDSWCIDVDYDLSNVTERRMLPERVFGCRIGPFTSEDFDRLEGIVAEVVDYTWTSWQAFYLENYQVRCRTGGLIGTDLHDLYRQYWYKKDGTESELGHIGTHLFVEYRELARQRLRKGDLEYAAQYSQVCLNLSRWLTDVEHEVIEEFGSFAERWNQLTAVKENLVKKHATVAREGIAEFWRVNTAKFGSQGRITALTPNYQRVLRNLDPDKERNEILSKSRSNPYRRGYETAEKVSELLGPIGLGMWGILTEWPLEELRLRVPACSVEQLQKDSPLVPDLRAERLVEVGEANKLFDLPEKATDDLRTVFDQLDGDVPGVGKCALSELATEQGK